MNYRCTFPIGKYNALPLTYGVVTHFLTKSILVLNFLIYSFPVRQLSIPNMGKDTTWSWKPTSLDASQPIKWLRQPVAFTSEEKIKWINSTFHFVLQTSSVPVYLFVSTASLFFILQNIITHLTRSWKLLGWPTLWFGPLLLSSLSTKDVFHFFIWL